jgi:DNA-binding NtrC family response regulator
MPRIDGIGLLKRIKQEHLAGTEVIIMTAYGSIPLAVEAGKLGAYGFLIKPFRNEDIFPLLSRIETARREAGPPGGDPPQATMGNIDHAVVGQSPAMRRVKRMIEICTRSDANVLLCGETGVGKDLLAAAIHRNSPRRTLPFVKVGCTIFPSQLIESELYGHEKGSFTGAEQRRQGRFELAEGGTLYLDDVDDIPMEHQAKLLRAIEEKVFERVGGTTAIRANVRIVASTKRNLLPKINNGTFRQDLYYRLDVLRVNIPPLRERREDIPLLAEHLLKRIVTDRPARLEPSAIEALQRHNWPGNIRELYHLLQRVYLIGAGTITGELLLAEIDDVPQKELLPPGAFQATIDKTERELLETALQAAGGNKTAAAAALGMKPTTFRDKLAKHGLV